MSPTEQFRVVCELELRFFVHRRLYRCRDSEPGYVVQSTCNRDQMGLTSPLGGGRPTGRLNGGSSVVPEVGDRALALDPHRASGGPSTQGRANRKISMVAQRNASVLTYAGFSESE